MTEKSVSELYKEHIDELKRRAEAGDEFSIKSLCCLTLLCEGWRYGDPDPEDPDDGPGGGSEVDEENFIDLSAYRMRLAA